MKYEAGAVLYNGRKNVLWGAGQRGIRTLLALCGMGIYVDLVCDSDETVQGLRLFHKKVVSPDAVLSGNQDCNIIIAVEKEAYIKEIGDRLARAGKKNYVIWRDIYDDAISFRFVRRELYDMICDSDVRKIAIYGTEEEGRELRDVLGMLDVRTEFFLEDVEEEEEKDGIPVKPVYDFIYEKKEDFKIIVTGHKTRRAKVLDEMGLQERADYSLCGERIAQNRRRRLYLLDPHLGHNLLGKGDAGRLGFVEAGGVDDFTIVLLGGSTTDGMRDPFPSWGEFLYGKLSENGYAVRILNGGCSGYRSSQELIKLIRDVIPLKPDVLLHYTGFNDSNNLDTQCVFTHPFQKELLDYVTGMDDGGGKVRDICSRKAYTLGMDGTRPTWTVFLDNIRMMDAICRAYGIRYCPFLQPSLPLKDRRSRHEREVILNTVSADRMASIERQVKEFCGHVKQCRDVPLEDLTRLFDDCDDVYVDYCHVTEQGNEKIARYMYSYLTEKGIVKK